MNLAQITQLALRQLGEDMEDMEEYAEMFNVYANMGYDIAVREFVKPREHFALWIGLDGWADLEGLPIERVVKVCDAAGHEWPFARSADGRRLRLLGASMLRAATDERDCAMRDIPNTDDGEGRRMPNVLHAVCEVRRPPLLQPTDEPALPPSAQAAIADYICYRVLSNGNAAKQSRADFYMNSFYRQMRALRQEGFGSVTRMRNLYGATDIRTLAGL